MTDQDKAQHARFVETAKQLGCNEDEAAFKEKLAVIAKQRPDSKDKAKSRRERDPQQQRSQK